MKRATGLSALVLSLILILCTPVIFWGCGDEEETFAGGDNQASKQIEFVVPVKADQYANVAGEYNLRTEEINFQVGEFSGGYTLRSGDLKNELLSARETFIKNMADVLKLKEMDSKNDSAGLRQSIQAAINAAVQDRMLFSRATVRGSAEVLAGMSQKGIIAALPDEKVIQSAKPLAAPQSSSHESWAPYRGTTNVSRSYIFNTFFFDNGYRFAWENTYEHETHLYKFYANYGGCWFSNLPRAYKDTQLFEPNNNLDNFTIGSAQASSIQPYAEYFTYMTLTPESNVRSDLWIKGQIGSRNPSWYYWTWCIFAIATTERMYGGANVAPMAGGVSWGY